MVKTAPLNNDTYVYLKKVQMTLIEKYNRRVTIADILSGMSNILTDVGDTARKIIMMRQLDDECMTSLDNKHGTNGDKLKHSGMVLIEEDTKT